MNQNDSTVRPATKGMPIPENSVIRDQADNAARPQSITNEVQATEHNGYGEGYHDRVRSDTQLQPPSTVPAPLQFDLASTVVTVPKAPKISSNYAGWLGKAGELRIKTDEDRDLRYPCSFEHCLAAFETKRQLKHHKKNKHDYCSICKIDFPNWEAYHQHKMDSTEHITCPVCSEDFATVDGRNRHSRTVSISLKCLQTSTNQDKMHPKAQNLECLGCAQSFIRGSELIKHMEENRCSNITKDQLARSRMLYGILKVQLELKLGSGSKYESDYEPIGSNFKNSTGSLQPDHRGEPSAQAHESKKQEDSDGWKAPGKLLARAEKLYANMHQREKRKWSAYLVSY